MLHFVSKFILYQMALLGAAFYGGKLSEHPNPFSISNMKNSATEFVKSKLPAQLTPRPTAPAPMPVPTAPAPIPATTSQLFNTNSPTPLTDEQISQMIQNGHKHISNGASWFSTTVLPHLKTTAGLAALVYMVHDIATTGATPPPQQVPGATPPPATMLPTATQNKLEKLKNYALGSAGFLGLRDLYNNGHESIVAKIYYALHNAGITASSYSKTSLVGITTLAALLNYHQQIWANCPTKQQVLDAPYDVAQYLWKNKGNVAKIAGITGAVLGANFAIRGDASILSHLYNNPSGQGIVPCVFDNITAPVWTIIDMLKRVPETNIRSTPITSASAAAAAAAAGEGEGSGVNSFWSGGIENQLQNMEIK